MSEIVQFSFALSPRMRAFIEVRDALVCLESAYVTQNTFYWLHSACDLRASLLGDQGRKHVIPEIIGLFQDMKAHLKKLVEDLPHYSGKVQTACDNIDTHIEKLQDGMADACNFLARDALINAHLNNQKKHDWLGHRSCMQQSLKALWKSPDDRTTPLHHALVPLSDAVNTLDSMLNDFVSWSKHIAQAGVGQISPERKISYGLLVIGLPEDEVARGIIPDISGNRLAIRVRFQQWLPGQEPKDVHEDLPYSMMLIPVGA
ncbi:hypothetical protein MMIC_P0485 [Mariprofundus micogutta]|uniref:Cell division protein ZapD n=1 Tax=Mariprofundus micogutta TaxID=1921010 RepID=A0A1L8CKU8_9PROT|nr:cell division protein ZapD [Mariprofundus micogutta]GAV19548.1 hypothetical protein MMIC_P0485 [Mariprofundus micogutta]